MTDISIPSAALEAGRKAYEEAWRMFDPEPLRLAFLAMIEAWPGMRHRPEVPSLHASPSWPGALILPIQETQDAET